MMNMNVKLAMRGRYQLRVIKDGIVQRQTGWFDNLITDLGLNLFTTSAVWSDWCQVGSSSTTPAFTDTALGSRIAGVQNTISFTSSIDATNRYLILTKSFTFSAGAAAGNIAEVGVGTAGTGSVLFSRALVLDSGGNPTTITVLAGEDLVVVYQLWVKQPTGDFVGDVGGNAVTTRASNVNDTSSAGWAANSRQQAVPYVANASCVAYTGTIGGITAAPSGTSSSNTFAGVAVTSYVADSHERIGSFTFTTSQANLAIKSFRWAFGPTQWQTEVADAITKNNTQTFRFGVKLSWSRDSGPA